MWKTWTGATQPAAPLSSPQGAGPMAGIGGQWHPTVIALGLLCLAEILIVGWITKSMLRG